MEMTENELRLLLNFATAYAARAVGLKQSFEDDIYPIDELRRRDPKLAKTLGEFRQAHESWYYFHKRRESESVRGTTEDLAQLPKLAEERDRTRSAFVHQLRRAEAEHPNKP